MSWQTLKKTKKEDENAFFIFSLKQNLGDSASKPVITHKFLFFNTLFKISGIFFILFRKNKCFMDTHLILG